MPALPIWLWLLAGAGVVAVTAKVLSAPSSGIAAEARAYKTPRVLSTEQFIYRPPSRAVRPIGPECVRVQVGLGASDEMRCAGTGPFDMAPPVEGPPFVFYSEHGTGLDVTSQWWMWIADLQGTTFDLHPDPRLAGWYTASPSDGSKDLIDYIEEYVPVVLEAAAIYVATLYGGPAGGMAVKTAIVAIKRIANGTPVGQALVDVASKEFANYIEKTEFGRAYKTFADNKYTRDAVLKVRNEVVSQFSTDTQEDVAKAFDDGLAIGRAKRVQELAIAKVKERLPPAHRGWLQNDEKTGCLDRGATLRDWCYAYGGNTATDLLSRIVSLATEYVEGGEVGPFLPYVGNVYEGAKPVVISPIRPITFVRKF